MSPEDAEQQMINAVLDNYTEKVAAIFKEIQGESPVAEAVAILSVAEVVVGDLLQDRYDMTEDQLYAVIEQAWAVVRGARQKVRLIMSPPAGSG